MAISKELFLAILSMDAYNHRNTAQLADKVRRGEPRPTSTPPSYAACGRSRAGG